MTDKRRYLARAVVNGVERIIEITEEEMQLLIEAGASVAEEPIEIPEPEAEA